MEISRGRASWKEQGDGTALDVLNAYCMKRLRLLTWHQIALREAGRRNAEYKPHALTTLGDVAAVDDMPDMFEKTFQLVESTVGDMTDTQGDESLVDDL